MHQLAYRVEIARPETQRIEVTVQVTGHRSREAYLSFPRWAPGWYVFRDYARHVEAASAASARGEPLEMEKSSVSTWRVRTRGNRRFSVTFRIYCGKWGDAYSHVDATHASLFGPSVFPFVHDRTTEPVALELDFPESWLAISTGLPVAGDDDRSFRAQNYDELLDCPIEIGNHEVYRFSAGGKPHELAVVGGPIPTPGERLTSDLRKIVEEAGRLFGELPYDRYVFLLYVTPAPTGSLEHRNSTTLTMKPECFHAEPEYVKKWLATASHEFFHLYNVKRIRPAELVPFDYLHEQRSPQLWVFEGLTSYYDDLVLVRAGLMDEKVWLGKLGKNVCLLRSMPGRKLESLADSSRDAWVKFMVKDENWQNRGISFYTKGLLVGFCLDLEIRRRSNDNQSLDDVMRSIYRDSRSSGYRGLTEARFRKLCEDAAGSVLPVIFDTYVHTTEPIDFDTHLAAAGLKLTPDRKKPGELGRPEKDQGWLGLETTSTEGRLLVARIPTETPAHRAGLAPGDELLFLDGRRIESAADFDARIQWATPGDTLTLTISRYGRRRELPAQVGQHPVTTFLVVPDRKATAAAKRRRQRLLSGR